ncbi:UDP-N-acetylmuramate--L-alanine ligase [Cellulophaga baltica]|uniref:UDP-N-acetylmuramate--L-alanine ligase n=2 Tax=Cellulophaga baltica TaxID=76594 RepID=A0A1G7CPR6_9FLAO|nr:UDP-N-acetylmuramate--L-alanine ligase [Cellulophaga baltica]AIZ41595.1 UDP-N-acetylmuramate--alanine ligase [Cellulophaga baltica 18]SDE41309.1 UDP-N-acetylmuramate--L-alanine ligase [Cellulophaga baltica]
MNMNQIHSVYFLGIGGIGMSALARYFVYLGKNVGGYDKTPSPLTLELEETGMAIHYDDDVALIAPNFLDKETCLIVYTPAVPKEHSELNYFFDQKFTVKKRSEVLGLVTNETFCFAVAGTHGKTTTSSILAHILKEAHVPMTAFLGGISEDFGSNFYFQGSEYSVVEADEFDRSFLRLSPNIACITSMDADHLDIYGTGEELQKSFREFAARIKVGGKLFVRNGLPMEGITYGIEDAADYCAKNVEIVNGAYVFELQTPTVLYKGIRFKKPGRHNLLNAVVALGMALEANVKPENLFPALESFKGVQRRFSYRIKNDDFVFIDDYAHHPTEINAVFEAVSEMHPGKKVLAVFQPHLFSRTKDFAEDFAESLSKFANVLLLDIYPAREKPIEGITSEWLLRKITSQHKKLVQKSELISEIQKQAPEVLIVMGAGDIGLEVVKIQKAIVNEG